MKVSLDISLSPPPLPSASLLRLSPPPLPSAPPLPPPPPPPYSLFFLFLLFFIYIFIYFLYFFSFSSSSPLPLSSLPLSSIPRLHSSPPPLPSLNSPLPPLLPMASPFYPPPFSSSSPLYLSFIQLSALSLFASSLSSYNVSDQPLVAHPAVKKLAESVDLNSTCGYLTLLNSTAIGKRSPSSNSLDTVSMLEFSLSSIHKWNYSRTMTTIVTLSQHPYV